MTLVFLVRHGLTATTGNVLTGWTPGIPLDDRGQQQAEALAARLAPVPLDAIISSPLERCRQTADAIAAAGEGRPAVVLEDERLGECHYGDWTGQPLKRLAKEPLWRVVQAHPGAARFPGEDGESIMDMQHRAVSAVRDWNRRLGAQGDVPDLLARRRDQVHHRRQPRHAHRHAAADPGRPVLAHGDPVHAAAPVRAAHE